jgi:SAM pointed domain-containing ETS transcription factor
MPKFPHYQNCNSQQQGSLTTPTLESAASYCNLADTFDLSLLGDVYDDHDMATVPSPSWSPQGALEPPYWQQVSFYGGSPSGGDYRAFSPDCKPSALLSANSSPVHLPSYIQDPSNNIVVGDVNALCGSSGESDRHLLLRQCLEDTTFQRKFNFKPMEFPGSNILGDGSENQLNVRELGGSPTSEVGVGSSLELNQIEPVFSLAFEQIKSDIQNTCSSLAISPDPTQWSNNDVLRWLTHTLSSLPNMTMMSGNEEAIRQFWNVNGRTLYSVTEEEFRRRDPLNGDRIFANLELWKMLQMQKNYSNANSQLHALQQQEQDIFDLEQLLLSPAMSSTMSPEPNLVPIIKLEDKSGSKSPVSSIDSSSSSSFPSPLGPEPMNTDDEDEDEDEDHDVKPNIGPKANSGTKTPSSNPPKSGAHIHLWQFLKELLTSPQQHGSCIRWLDQSRGVFKIEDSVRVARLWGLRKNRPAMNYDKLSRSIRQYYRKGIMRKTERSQRLVYQFCHPYGL